MRLIPGKTKVQIELFKGVTLMDVFIGGIAMAMLILALCSSMSSKGYVSIGILIITCGLLFRPDSEPTYVFIYHIIRNAVYKKNFSKVATDDKKSKEIPMEQIVPYTGISEGFIEYAGEYFGTVLEIPPVEFRFFSDHRRDNSVENGVGRTFRMMNPDYGFNIVKLEHPINYDQYLENEKKKLTELKLSFEQGALNEEELKARVDIVYDRLAELEGLCSDKRIVQPYYYLVLFGEHKDQLGVLTEEALTALSSGELNPYRLNDMELALFLKYTNDIDFDEHDVEAVDPADYVKWSMPDTVKVDSRTVRINKMVTHNLCVVNYPSLVGNAWLAGVMSMPSTKVVIKCKQADSEKAIRGIDRSLQELRGQYNATSIDSRLIELKNHMDTLGALLQMLQGENEILLDTNIYISCYDAYQSRYCAPDKELNTLRETMQSMKKAVRRVYNESGIRLTSMDFNQIPAFIGSQVSAYDPMYKQGRGIPSNTVAAAYPWIYAHVSDETGFKLGAADGVPVFIDFFHRDSERVNSNMVIVGKSGSGKSFATKSLLTNLAADDSKIFILDPENEYTEMATNLHGKFINVGNAQYGRLNPFHIITALDDDDSDGTSASGSYAIHLQFLEEFFRQILPECDKDALEYLNSLVDRMYYNHGINESTDLSKLSPESYPTFDDLYDEILSEFQETDNEYLRRMLRILVTYVAKFATGGRNANIWNGPSTVTTEENLTVFNFQSLLANRNGSIANAQMLLVLKYIDNEIIKNREYNLRYGRSRKIIVAIDEAHVFIDSKYPVALDFMFQLAKRIRKYNGMQIVITQNIKDFVGSEEIARKSTAIINACQYSFIFSLAPNDMDDLCKLYSKAGGINENEQEQIVSAARGQAFTIMSPQSRSSFKVVVPQDVVDIYTKPGYESGYFRGEEGARNWADYIGNSREAREENLVEEMLRKEIAETETEKLSTCDKKVKVQLIETDEVPEIIKQAPDMFEQEAEILLMSTDRKEPETEEGKPEKTASKKTAVTSERQAAEVMSSAIMPEFTKTVDKLGDMMESLSKFNYELLMENINKMKEDTVAEARAAAEEIISSRIAESAALAETEKNTVTEAPDELPEKAESEPEVPEETAWENDETTEEIPTEEAVDEDTYEDEDEADNTDFDLLSSLSDIIGGNGGLTVIDMMENYDEDTVAITLEDLGAYIISNRIR